MVPRERMAHVPPPVRVPRVHQVFKVLLEQLESVACLGSRV